ncbi:hypothetical protein FACS1894133_4120 [Clostridia bacterium]|nr:hypothetical protein FACS1894133_4120 [Clostridia bacterium]
MCVSGDGNMGDTAGSTIDIDHLAVLSKLSFNASEKAAFAGDMADIVALMDKVKDFDVVYDDTKEL